MKPYIASNNRYTNLFVTGVIATLLFVVVSAAFWLKCGINHLYAWVVAIEAAFLGCGYVLSVATWIRRPFWGAVGAFQAYFHPDLVRSWVCAVLLLVSVFVGLICLLIFGIERGRPGFVMLGIVGGGLLRA